MWTIWYLLLRWDLWLLVGVPLAVLIWFLWYGRRRGRSLARGAPRAARAVRFCEALALALIGGAMLLFLALYRDINRVPALFADEVPAPMKALHWQQLSIAAAGLAIGVGLAYWRYVTTAVLLLTGLFAVTGFVVNEGLMEMPETTRQAIEGTPIPLEIHLSDDVRGADVWVNGVHVGQTPVRTTVEDLLAKAPEWTQVPEIEGPDEYHSIPHYTIRGKGASHYRRWIRYPFSVRTSVEPGGVTLQRKLFFRVRFQDVEGFGMRHQGSGHGGGRVFGTIQPVSVQLNAFFPKWDEHIEFLVDRARLADYQVGPEWFNSIRSYGSRGWELLGRGATDEPELANIRDAWARRQYGLTDVRDSKSAWRVLESICAEADKRARYASDSPAGRAVELLVAQLDQEQLVRRAERFLAHRHSVSTGSSMSYGVRNGRFQFATHPDYGWQPRDGISAGVLPVAHAIWCLDERLDAEHPRSDNIVERRVTPALMRIDPDRQSMLELAAVLGGSAYEQSLSRRDWRSRPSPHDYDDTIHVNGDIPVNRWFYLLATQDSPSGARFRAANADGVLRLAESLIENRTSDIRRGYWDSELDFLFLDTEGQSLAMTFWPRFKELAGIDADPYEKITVLWAYLARAYPDSTPKMFVDVYRECGGEERLQNSTFTPLDLLPPDGKFAVLESLLVEIDGRLEQEDPEAIRMGRSIYKMDRDELPSRMLLLRCEAAAKRFVAYVASDDSTRYRDAIAEWVANTRPHIAVLKGLAASDDPDLRRMAVGAALNDPMPSYRQVMSDLEDDSAEEVREALKDAMATHETWLKQTLPRSGRKLVPE